MIGTRAVSLLRIVSNVTPRKILTSNVQQVRMSGHGDWHYRTPCQPPKWSRYGATAAACLVWWWFYWNMWHGWTHIVGYYDHEKPLPDPRHDFTDEELGIPPDE
ncbi:hypothetical protein QAD02_005390 [Eretmocerus hayati]|uniref:Uncharacterized protein n=1 Tax=Eretmocerus hayati TaxID=131215 RepID=A0ACC2NTE5_9HYME|nr:hypothetical protein QAD02_005390 [Eretmocerus hayati]